MCTRRLTSKPMLKRLSSKLAIDRRQPLSYYWIPVLFGLGVICCESTKTMGAAHTQLWLGELLSHLHAQEAAGDLGTANTVLRKTGHFCGYGLLGLLFTRGWLAVVMRFRRKAWAVARARAAGFGVCSAAVIASLDELHQSFLAGRTASGWDVLLDSCGALTLVGGYFLFRWAQRHQTFEELRTFRTLLQRGRQRRAFFEALRTLESVSRRIAR